MLKRLRKLISSATVVSVSRSKTSIEQRIVLLSGQHIPYTLKRSTRRRSIGLRIDAKGLTVSMPHQTPERWLNEVLQDRAEWVVEKLGGLQSLPEPQWHDGATVPYLGELLTLRVVSQAVPVHQCGAELVVYGNEARVEKLVALWYRQQATLLFAARIAHFAALLKVSPSSIKLSGAKTRWGSCTSRGVVRLNLQLIKLPPYLIDYVVVHELAHLREMNHSAAFWRVVQSACPDYEKRRAELKGCRL
jgi:hypothetical protein